MIGSVLNDRYRIDAELGRGGMGTVYRAFDVTLERQVAVKLVTGYQLETEGRARVLQEAKAIAQLNHPHIVSVYDAGSAKLMDFGIARSVASRLTQEGQIQGTLSSMAPEPALGKEYDGCAELYALGVMLYELTTGGWPFQHGDPIA